MAGFFSPGGGGAGLDAALFLAKTGGTMSGPLVLYGDPMAPREAVPREYLEAQLQALADDIIIEVDMPSEFVVTGSPVTKAGMFSIALADQQANYVFAGPVSGADAPPSFRHLVAADISDLSDVTDLYLPLTGGTLTGSLDITGDLDITGNYLLNGQSLIEIAQTPWLNNINADSKSLRNIRAIGGVKSSTPGSDERAPVEIASNLTVTGPFGEVTEGNDEGLLLTYYPYVPGLPGQKFGIIRCASPASRPIESTRIPLHILGYDILLNCFYQGDGLNTPASGGNVFIGTDNTANLAQPGLPFKSTQWNVGVEDATNLTVGGSIVKYNAFLNLVGPSSYLTFSDLSNGVLAAIEGTGGEIKFYNNGATGMQERMRIASDIGIGNDASVFPVSVASPHGLQCIVGRTAPHAMTGNTGATRFSIVGNTQLTGVICANLQFANYAITAANKALAAINVVTAGADYNSGHMLFVTKDGSNWAERMRITSAGNVGIGNDASVIPTGPIIGANLLVGSNAPVAGAGPSDYLGRITLCRNTTDMDVHCGILAFANFGKSSNPNEKRLAYITASTGATNYETGDLKFYTNSGVSNAERMRITSAGYVGIGNDASNLPQASALRTLIVGNTAGATMYGCVAMVGNTANTSAAVGDLTFANYNIAAAEKRLAVITGRTDGAVDSGALAFYTMESGSITGTEKLRITSAGYIGINYTTPTYILDINYIRSDDYGFRLSGPYGPITMDVSTGVGSSRYMLSLNRDSAAKPGTNTWTIVSDVRTKRNVLPFEGGMETIRKLEPIVAEYNGKAHMPDGQRVVSLDPLQLRDAVPAAVSSIRGKLEDGDAEETDILGVNTHEIFYHLLRAVQQLDQRLSKLEPTAGTEPEPFDMGGI